jgi:hypothetical protein
MSGSPPAIETIGAPHSSIALTACSTPEHVVGMLDLAAPRALQVALVERLELDEQRKALAARKSLLGDVGAEAQALTEGYRHGFRDPFVVAAEA